jgi:hypothetical protein
MKLSDAVEKSMPFIDTATATTPENCTGGDTHHIAVEFIS